MRYKLLGRSGLIPGPGGGEQVRQQQSQALMIPIPGARSAEQLQDNLSILEREMTTE